MQNMYKKVAVVVLGWCPPTIVDIEASNNAISRAFSMVKQKFPADQYVLISGLTDVGAHSHVYREAEALHWELHGVACAKAYQHAIYPVKKAIIAGSEWDDFEEFDGLIQHALSQNATLVVLNIGGGEKAKEVMEAFGHIGAFIYDSKLERQ